MEEIQSLYEKKIDAMMSKMFGDGDSQLKAITKLTLMNTVLTDDMKQTLIAMREQQRKEAEMINEEMTMTLDASGNVVPIELSPRQQDIKITHDTVKEDDRDN
jgi:polyhydroxyalkanoate synthesis regulator protein